MPGSTKIPSPPSLTKEELELIEEQGLTLEEFRDLLRESAKEGGEIRDVLKRLSGLFREEVTPETRGEDVTKTIVDPEAKVKAGEFFEQALFNKGDKGLTNEQAVESLRGQAPDAFLDAVLKDLKSPFGKRRGVDPLVTSFQKVTGTPKQLLDLGFNVEETTAGEIIPETSELVLDEEAFADLTGRVDEALEFQTGQVEDARAIDERVTGIVDKALTQLESSFDVDPDVLEQQQQITEKNIEIAELQTDRQIAALRGELDVGTEFPEFAERKKKDFRQLRELGDIIGDDPDTAVGTTSASIARLSAFRTRFDTVESNIRRGQLTSGTAAIIAQQGLISDLTGVGINRALTFKGTFGPTASQTPGFDQTLAVLTGSGNFGANQALAGFPSVFQGFGQLQQPFANQRSSIFSRDIANAQLGSQRISDLFSLGGIALGATLISSKKHKKNIKPLTEKTEEKVLQLVRKGNIYTWDYNWEKSGRVPKHIGIIAEEAPHPIATPDRKAQDLGNTVNLLLTSVRALDRKIDRKFALTRKVA